MRSAIHRWIALSLCALVLTSCGSAGTVESLDSRVVNGVVQRPGGSGYSDQQWVRGKVVELALPEVERCLEDKGRADAIPRAQEFLERDLSSFYAYFPPVVRYREIGLETEISTSGLTNEEMELSDLVTDCFRDEVQNSRGRSVPTQIMRLEMKWAGDISVYLNDNPMLDEFHQMEACLAEEAGYPPEGVKPGFAPNLYAFVSWWADGHGGRLDMSQEDNLEGGRIFAVCLEPYTEALAEDTDEMREKFIQDNYRTLKRINDELVG